MPKPKIIAIVGPTSSGKTSLGILLAKKFGGEVVSADSRQVYKGLNLGTGKVTKKEMAGVPHHLLDVASPKQQFSADDFLRLGNKALVMIHNNNHIPMVVGGTGLYVDALLGRVVFPRVPPNPTLRAQLEKKSVTALFALLKKLDPARATTVEPQHKRRLIRAIEVAKAIGASPTPHTEKKYDVLWLGLKPEEEKLKKNIHTRLQTRLKAGMVTEARNLHAKGLSYKRMHELGLEYRSLALLLQNKLTRKEFEVEIERAIQQYAKRQWRWFKRNKEITWVHNKTQAILLVKKFLSTDRS